MVSLHYGLLSVWAVKQYLFIKLINKWFFLLCDIFVLMEHSVTIDTQIYITCCTISNQNSHLNTTPPMQFTSWFLNSWALWKVIILCLQSNWHCISWPKTHITYARSCILCYPTSVWTTREWQQTWTWECFTLSCWHRGR